MAKSSDALMQWLALTWERPERSYNPDIREFFAALLGYPKQRVITEDRAPIGFPDIKLQTAEGTPWVVGDLKKDDVQLLDPMRRESLWNDKRKYVEGLTRYVLFLTAHFLWIVTPEGHPVAGFQLPLDLRTVTQEELKARLQFLRYEVASHSRQWNDFVAGSMPYAYLKLTVPETLRQLRSDLRACFQELADAATRTMQTLEIEYREYSRRRSEIEQNLVGRVDTQRRALVRLHLEFSFVRRLFDESLSQFEEQYGRDIEANRPQEQTRRVQEAFVADSAAALIARVLFLRLVEDLQMQPRRLSNGGPKNWAAFVNNLTGDARALVRLVSEDMERVYREPFAPTVFDWIQRANGELDLSLQRLILRLNAYDFADLSEELLGDIYQQFLPVQKRKRLGEFYTPATIVEWILDKTVRAHGLGTVLDPACGSGSFLVRYAHWRLEDARQRCLNVAQVSEELQAEVWGFDLNPFAAFISLFQLMWALLRFDPTAPAPHLQVHNLNSLLRDTDIAAYIGEEHLPPGSKSRDQQKWKYVLGNPPYIRAERVKYGGEMRELWAHLWGQNADTGLVFLYRALTEWIEPQGLLGMVVSGGYANSETAGKVWQLLHPAQTAALRKIVWLEFAGKQWDANVIPMLLIVERTPARPDDEIELYVPSTWPDNDTLPVTVRYEDFFDQRINPRVTNGVSAWGDYLLPLLESGDIPVLRKLCPNGNGSAFEPLGNVSKWTYGIQRGGVEVTEAPAGTKPLPVIAGRGLAIAWGSEPAGWVDLDAVEKRPYGKLSLWRTEPYPSRYIALASIGLAPFAAVVATGTLHATLNSTIISHSMTIRPEAIAAYLNSRVARYYWALRLRTAVLQGSSRATFYPRTLEALPWPKTLAPETEQQLVEAYDRLAVLATRAKNNPHEWFLAEAERRLAESRVRITDPSLDLRFVDTAAEAPIEELQWEGNRLLPLAEFANSGIAEYIYRVLTLTIEEESIVKTQDIQKLVVPILYEALLDEYHGRMHSFRQVETDFMQALEELDTVVFTTFDLLAEQTYIKQRLAKFPLDRLQPRYPWQAVRPRPIKSYTEDRFV